MESKQHCGAIKIKERNILLKEVPLIVTAKNGKKLLLKFLFITAHLIIEPLIRILKEFCGAIYIRHPLRSRFY